MGQSIIPTFAGIMELVMRAAAGLFLVDAFGYIGDVKKIVAKYKEHMIWNAKMMK